ncbi:hypothetical protein SCLCIDRAFT_31926 [Scleroderma citrinum Foug A]|uniref:Uncharacterized protein n=1 Tax=Scleroderma citrinum Foug A TaxID=1036808 RepID=A0A0C3CXT0_9AGAM|nr:hypothetical protein SCLCIDRAFT_31926 [Scleroderma citrinum Foug A]
MPQSPHRSPPTRQRASSESNLNVLITLLERLALSPADSAVLATILTAKSLDAGSAPAPEATAHVEPTSPIPLSTIYTSPAFPSSPSASSGTGSAIPSSPSSWDTFGLRSSFGSPQSQLPLTLATSPTSAYIDELLDPAPPTSTYTGPTTPIAVTLITSPRSKPKEHVIYYMDLEYEEALASCADECFLHQYCGLYYNIPMRINSKAQFYCVTKGTHIGIFNGWDQAAVEVLKTTRGHRSDDDEDMQSSPHSPVPASCKVKPCAAIEPPEGWEEHMFGLRDWRPVTPTASPLQRSASRVLTVQTPQLHEEHVPDAEKGTEGQSDDGVNEIETETLAQITDQVVGDGAEGEGDEDEDEDEEMNQNEAVDDGSQDCSNYSSDKCAVKVKKATERIACGDQSSLPLLSPPEESGSEESEPDVEEDQSPSPSRKSRKMAAGNKSGHDGSELPLPKKPGTLLNEALEEILAAGFGIKPSHTKVNEANLFRLWYWATQPKPEGATRNEFNNIITKEYNDLMKDIPKDDITARREKLKDIYEWSKASLVIPSNKSVKSIAAKLENAKVQCSGLAEAWCNLEEIEIVGVLMYVGEDPAGRQLSGIFGRSDMIRKFINDCSIDVRALMDKYTSIFKCLRNGDGSSISLLGSNSSMELDPVLELRCHPREIPRDWDRRIFGTMMREKLAAALKEQRGVDFTHAFTQCESK